MSVAHGEEGVVRAAHDGDTGAVIRFARQAAGLTQRQLGEACGYSQPVVSRIERGHRSAYDIRTLRRLAEVLDLSPHVLGLAMQQDGRVGESMNRRDFIATAGTLALSTFLPRTGPGPAGTAASIRAITASQRRLDAVVASRDLVEPVISHLRMASQVAGRFARTGQHRELAEAVSEIAGLAAWLHWDMQDLGSARRYYDLAVAAARSSGNRVLAAYMVGSLAACLAETGDGLEALDLLSAASAQVGPRPPAVAQAWLSALTAVAHASAKDLRSADAALDRAESASERISAEDPPPWPWVFSFDDSKVAAYRLSCSVRTGRAGSALRAALDASSSLASTTKQAGMWRMDHATAYLQAGEMERAFTIATDVLDERTGQASPRLLARATQLAHTQGGGGHSSPAWRELDERLRARSHGRGV
jgi:transcriptional regulator with XRE-family HTH domain